MSIGHIILFFALAAVVAWYIYTCLIERMDALEHGMMNLYMDKRKFDEKNVRRIIAAIEDATKTPLYTGERSESKAEIIDPDKDPMAEFGDDRDDWID